MLVANDFKPIIVLDGQQLPTKRETDLERRK